MIIFYWFFFSFLFHFRWCRQVISGARYYAIARRFGHTGRDRTRFRSFQNFRFDRSRKTCARSRQQRQTDDDDVIELGFEPETDDNADSPAEHFRNEFRHENTNFKVGTCRIHNDNDVFVERAKNY